MKLKITSAIFGLFFVAGIASSCGASKKGGCEGAYGQAKIKQNADLASK